MLTIIIVNELQHGFQTTIPDYMTYFFLWLFFGSYTLTLGYDGSAESY